MRILPKTIFINLLFIFVFSCGLEGRLYFLHIPKTGGTTLRLLLESQLAAQEIFPFRNTRSEVGLVKENLVSGHFPYWFCRNLDDQFDDAFKVTILRDPVERYLSFLRAKKKADGTLPDLESVLNLRQMPNNPYSEGLVDNAFCRFLTTNPFLEGEPLLEDAKGTLDKFDCLIFFDHFASDIIDLSKRLGIDLDVEDIPKLNATDPEPVSIELLEEVRGLNKLDIQLYEYAKNHFQKKNTPYPLRTSSFYKVIKKTSEVDYTFDLPLYGSGWTYRDTLGNEKNALPVYRWVMDYPAKIYFALEEGKDYLLFFNARPLTEECIPRVQVNGVELALARLNTEIFSLYKGTISKDCIDSNFTEIAFFSDKAFQYRDVYPSHYNRNHPPLSFAVNRIQITSEPLTSRFHH